MNYTGERAPALKLGDQISRLTGQVRHKGRSSINPAASIIKDGMALTLSTIQCYSFNRTRDNAYWKFHLSLLERVIMDERIPDDVCEGIIISFLTAPLTEPATVFSVMNKHHGIRIQHTAFESEHGEARGETDAARRILNNLLPDEWMGTPGAFYHDTAVDLHRPPGEKAYITAVGHIFFLASKAVTASTSAIETARKRMDAASNSMPIDLTWALSDKAAGKICEIIRGSIAVRRSIVNVGIACSQARGFSSNLSTVITHPLSYLVDAGLTGFILVCQYVIQARCPLMAVNTYRSELSHLLDIMQLYASLGSDAPYIKFLGHPTADQFNPAHYMNFYAYAIGFGSIVAPTVASYTTAGNLSETVCYRLGRLYATRANFQTSDVLAADLGMSGQEVEELKSMISEVKAECGVEMNAGEDDVGGIL